MERSVSVCLYSTSVSLTVFTSIVWIDPSVRSGAPIHFGEPVPIAVHVCLWSTMGLLEKLVPITRNWTLVQTSCTRSPGSILCAGMAGVIHTIAVWPYLVPSTTTGDYLSARIVIVSAAQLVACSLGPSEAIHTAISSLLWTFHPLLVSSMMLNARVLYCIPLLLSSNSILDISRSEKGSDCQLLDDSEPSSNIQDSNLYDKLCHVLIINWLFCCRSQFSSFERLDAIFPLWFHAFLIN